MTIISDITLDDSPPTSPNGNKIKNNNAADCSLEIESDDDDNVEESVICISDSDEDSPSAKRSR